MSAQQATHPGECLDVALSARGVGVAMGGATILSGVDLDVRAGEVVALVGPNGAGKSTLLSVLAGDVDPDAGAVTLLGEPVRGRSAADLARRRAVVLQRSTLSFGFRVREVVEMGRAVWRRTPAEDRDDQVVTQAMRAADVEHLSQRTVPTLSGGEQARVAFARMLAQEVEVHLLDEPTAALDIRHQEALLARAASAARAGAAVVVVLHDLSLAAAWADRICVLDRGRVRAVGIPREVLTADLLTEVYEHPIRVIDAEDHLLVVPVRGAHAEERP